MESPNNSSRPKLHPLVATAAVSIILLSAVGIGAMVMSHSNATPSPYDAPTISQAPLAQTPTQPTAAAETAAPKALPRPSQPTRLAAAAPTVHRPTTPSYGAPSTPYGTSATPAYERPAAVAQVAVCPDCGVVDSIHDIKVKGQGTGVGGVGGAVVGGLLGNQIGAGRGKALATVAGALGGAFAGNAIEKNVRSEVEHQMVVRLEDGTTRTFTQASPFAFGVGERVRVVNGHVERG